MGANRSTRWTCGSLVPGSRAVVVVGLVWSSAGRAGSVVVGVQGPAGEDGLSRGRRALRGTRVLRDQVTQQLEDLVGAVVARCVVQVLEPGPEAARAHRWQRHRDAGVDGRDPFLPVTEQLLVELLARTQAGEPEVDGGDAQEPREVLDELDDLHGLAHV